MRKDEIRAAEQIVSFLGSRYPGGEISFNPGEDPPDAYLNIGDKRYALEITSTEVPRQPIFGDSPIREFTYMHSHRRILKEVEAEAKEVGGLHGKYAITFSKPLSTDDFSSLRSVFKSQLLVKLKELASAPIGKEAVIDYDYTELAWVYKLSDQGAKLYDVFEDGAWTESPDFIQFVRTLFLRAILRKFDKISHVIDPSSCVLVIIDTYGLADALTIVHACEGIQELTSFHSVIVLLGKYTLVLHSKQVEWISGDA